MSTDNFGHPGNEASNHPTVKRPDTPYWKRAHLDWRMWTGLAFMFAAITIYVLSGNLAFLPYR
jgi:hypothetical protein